MEKPTVEKPVKKVVRNVSSSPSPKKKTVSKSKEKNVKVNDMGDKLITLITDLGWEYQRMGRSGRQVFDEIHQLLGTIPEGEVYMEI